MAGERQVWAEWYSLGVQAVTGGTCETRAMLVRGAGVLVQVETVTAAGRIALATHWLPGVTLYEGRLVGAEWVERLMQLQAQPVPPVSAPPPLVAVGAAADPVPTGALSDPVQVGSRKAASTTGKRARPGLRKAKPVAP
jgi:hypothetical protein